MKHWQLPSGRHNGLPFIIAQDWTSEQAVAVVELLDDLREAICQHYQVQIQAYMREHRRTYFGSPDQVDQDDEPL